MFSSMQLLFNRGKIDLKTFFLSPFSSSNECRIRRRRLRQQHFWLLFDWCCFCINLSFISVLVVTATGAFFISCYLFYFSFFRLVKKKFRLNFTNKNRPWTIGKLFPQFVVSSSGITGTSTATIKWIEKFNKTQQKNNSQANQPAIARAGSSKVTTSEKKADFLRSFHFRSSVKLSAQSILICSNGTRNLRKKSRKQR